jgi:hypothetical protein
MVLSGRFHFVDLVSPCNDHHLELKYQIICCWFLTTRQPVAVVLVSDS